MLTGKRIAIIGGCGHVGLPLGVKFAQAGARVALVDIDEAKILQVNSGRFPFVEHDGDEQLKRALQRGLLATNDRAICADADVIVFVTGTPVDEHLNPKLSEVVKVFDAYAQYFHDEMLIVMRSTLYPGTMAHLYQRVRTAGHRVLMAFCPERVAQGYALDEIDSLPQVVSAFDEPSFSAAYQLFSALAPSVIRLSPLEAELVKLMANSWRYLEFAIANEFYMIAETHGVDFSRVYQAIRYDYPRAAGYKAPGFAAGPCLFKDTMQLASFYDHKSYMGHAAMLVNEGLATHVVEKVLEKLGNTVWDRTVGLLGMTFKANNDDVRESLSFKVKKSLEFYGIKVICHDPFLSSAVPLDRVLADSEVLVLCMPHDEYQSVKPAVPFVDVWGVWHKGEIEVLPGRQ